MTAADRPPVTDYPDASEVLDVIYEVGYAASSTVQRKLGLTFGQAEDVLAALGRCGVVGKAKGSAARKILVTRPEAEVILGMDDPEAMAPEVPVQDHPRLSVHDVIGALGDLPEGEDSVSVIRKQRDAADRPSVTDTARAALLGTDTEEGALTLDRPASDGTAYSEGVADGYADAELIVRTTLDRLAAGRAETTTATDEDAVEVAYRMAYDVMRYHPGIWHDSLRAAVEALADAGLLATARTRPTRDELLADQPDAADVWDQAVKWARDHAAERRRWHHSEGRYPPTHPATHNPYRTDGDDQ